MNKEIIRESRILIVDDKQANAVLMEQVLRRAGYLNYTSINDSREVVDQLRTFRPDLIVLDLMMPHVDGYGVMTQLRGYIPDGIYLPILVITADVSKAARERALSLGAKDFLTKPVDTTEATLRIYNLLETRWLYQQSQAERELLIEQVQEVQQHLSAINAELDRLGTLGIPAGQLASARQLMSKALESVERIAEATKTAASNEPVELETALF